MSCSRWWLCHRQKKARATCVSYTETSCRLSVQVATLVFQTVIRKLLSAFLSASRARFSLWLWMAEVRFCLLVLNPPTLFFVYYFSTKYITYCQPFTFTRFFYLTICEISFNFIYKLMKRIKKE